MKHIVVSSALIMTSTIVHAGVMPEDFMSPTVEVTADVVEQVIRHMQKKHSTEYLTLVR